MESVHRNDPCPCGSGLKYKRCCLQAGGVHHRRRARQAQWVAVAAVLAAIAFGFAFGTGYGLAVGGAGALVAAALVFFSDPPSSKGPGQPGAINFGR